MSSFKKYKCLTISEKKKVIESVEGERKVDVAKAFEIPLSSLSTILKNKEKIFSASSSRVRKRVSKENEWNSLQKNVLVESSSVDINVCSKWQSSLSDLIKEYEPRNIFNTDETGLFFKRLPEKTFTFKKEKCHGGKHSKERLTILLVVNMYGSEKITLLVIGKSAKPWCFKGINSFLTKYRSNKKAWMTTELFNEWLVALNSAMKIEKRHIHLFLDNCTVHKIAPPLSNVKLQFFPPNSTSKLQALDQGIMHKLKTFYRREVVKSVLDNIENQQNVTTISFLTALIMIDKAWGAVTPLTIHSCFKKSGFPSPNLVDVTIHSLNLMLNHPFGKLPEQDLTFDDYVLVDTDIAVWGALSDAEIAALDHNNTESDEDESEELTPVTLSEAKVSLNKLHNFFLQNHVDAVILQASFVLEKSIYKLEVPEELGIAQSVISRLWQRFQDDGNVSRCYSTGRPRVTTPNEDRYIWQLLPKETDGAQHQTCLVSSLQLPVRQFQGRPCTDA
ncbi:tigger transposable element-derived protein 6 [Trichonephila clavipes]|uniref:Tigger transposable element-derived protein 6 n=1 Tax=Trichonephila clavipes TaxID=2585209 RepID=A0A8X6VB70_TRICX|nr:tigger transposable element-derived protein 6 [Trichonephila clavipes]